MVQGRRIFHITHVDNLPGIVAAGGLHSDAARLASGHSSHVVGMSKIKSRRLTLPVRPHPGTHVGDYVPFYFCPRSIMLYVIHCANHPELTYRGGQGPIVHLSADLDTVVGRLESTGRTWAFSTSNAGSYYAQLFSGSHELHRVAWSHVGATDFRDPAVKEAKQAEFLVKDFCPLELFDEVAVINAAVGARARNHLSAGAHVPPVRVRPDWYY